MEKGVEEEGEAGKAGVVKCEERVGSIGKGTKRRTGDAAGR